MDQKKQGQQSEPFKGQQKWQEPQTPGGGPEKGGDIEKDSDVDRDVDKQDELPERGQPDESDR